MMNFVDRLLGTDDGFKVRKRIYVSTLLAGMVLTFFGGLMNYIMGLNVFSYIVPFFSLLVFTFFYFYTRKKEITDISFRLALGFTMFVFYPLFSFVNGGFLGGFHYFFAFFWVLAVTVLPGRNRAFLVGFLIVIFSVLIVDYLYPDLAAGYQDRTTRYIDLAISVLLLLAGLYVMLNIVMRAYDAAKLKLEVQNAKLEEVGRLLSDNNKVLDETNQSKDKFFSIIAHDLRGAFNSMLGFSDLLMTRYDTLTEAQKKQYFTLISSNIHKTYDFFENLLEWSRAQSGAIVISRTNENVFLLVKEVIDVLTLMAQKKEIALEMELADDLYYDLDKQVFLTLLRNLLSNALKYTPHQGRVRVVVTVGNEGQLIVSVIDSGVGMSSEDQEKLFVLAENKSRKGTDHEPGTGLGLLLCKELVERHEGEIRVQSALGEGSVFSLIFRSTQPSVEPVRDL